MVVLLAVAAPVTTRVARRYSWSLLISVVYKLWQWQTWWRAVKQNSDIRRVRGTRLTRAFKANLSYEYRSPTYGGMTRLGPFSNGFGFLMVVLAVCPQSPRSVRGPRRRLPPRGHISSVPSRSIG